METLHKQLNNLNGLVGGSISRLEGDRILQYHNDNGIGKVVSVALEAGVSYTEYNLDLSESLKVNLENSTGAALYFIYCLEGSIDYSWTNDVRQTKSIRELQTVILGSSIASLNIHVQKESTANFAVIKVDKTNRFQNSSADDYVLNQKLFHQFLTLSGAEPYEYRGTFNLKIREQLLQIRKIKQSGVIRKLLIKGIIQFALALELMHHQRDMELNDGLQTRLTKKELLRVKEGIDTISKNPQYHYSVTQLCREYGLSAAKLQEGFKILEGCTVSTYIKGKRVEMAEKLIQGGELNISEIVYSIGFTSRSYFSKIFKKRYQCSPKYYQEHCKNSIPAI